MDGVTKSIWLDQLVSSDCGRDSLRDLRITDWIWSPSSFSSWNLNCTSFAAVIAAALDAWVRRWWKGVKTELWVRL